jgi:hypothetical protein
MARALKTTSNNATGGNWILKNSDRPKRCASPSFGESVGRQGYRVILTPIFPLSSRPLLYYHPGDLECLRPHPQAPIFRPYPSPICAPMSYLIWALMWALLKCSDKMGLIHIITRWTSVDWFILDLQNFKEEKRCTRYCTVL